MPDFPPISTRHCGPRYRTIGIGAGINGFVRSFAVFSCEYNPGNLGPRGRDPCENSSMELAVPLVAQCRDIWPVGLPWQLTLGSCRLFFSKEESTQIVAIIDRV